MAFDAELVRISCQCGGEEVAVGIDPDWPSVDLSFWSAGMPTGHGFWKRLRAAWRVFRRGTPYADMVMLDAAEAVRLRDVLIDLVPKLEEMQARAEDT